MPSVVFRVLLAVLIVISQSLSALELTGQLTQGSLIRGKVAGAKAIFLDGKQIKLSDQGHFVFGFGRDADVEHSLVVQYQDGSTREKALTLSQREYQEQRIDGLPQTLVSPPESVLARIRQDNAQVSRARKRNDNRLDFFEPFIWPANGPISGVYGSRRILNGEPKRPHFGVDVAGPVGTPIYAPADGIVTLYVPDMYYSGGTMIIDHGFGVSSTFLHLDASHVEVGDTVKQGQRVADMGKTGRVTGAHLDWRINWFSERLDPALLVPKR